MAGEHIRKPIARMSVGPAWLWAGFLASAIKKMSWQAAAGSAGSNQLLFIKQTAPGVRPWSCCLSKRGREMDWRAEDISVHV